MRSTSEKHATARSRPARSEAGSGKPPRRTQDERSATTRRHLIDAAVECLSGLSYVEATVEVVASRAGVSRGAVQHHFGSRNDLLIAVVDDFGFALGGVDDLLPNRSTADRVSAAIDRTWERLRSPHFIAVLQIWLATRNVPEIVQVTSKKISLIERELDKQWHRLFAETGIPPQRIAVIRHIVLATLRGLALRSLYRQGRESWVEEIAMLKHMVIEALS